ncbi:uncharacterized protein LOC100215549 isoform X1 [Hydra vulgaris]|uniref:uncharacterized protein LOC100215549 isoform X1 n=1 Tax=Hydra vulgaris TaxID=6087 RepID=UPI0002B480C4|nr:uncharacterized protein LOC100215549 [Hydra vulgaris]
MGDEQERRRLWFELYGDMVPEKIVDTMIGEDGKRYYKVQWASTTIESSKNFLEAEHLIEKYWDPVEKRLKIPSKECDSTNLNDITGDNIDGGDSDKNSCGDASGTQVSFNNSSYEIYSSNIVNSKSDQSKEIADSLKHTQSHEVMLKVLNDYDIPATNSCNDEPDPDSQVHPAASLDTIVISTLPVKTINDACFFPSEKYDTTDYNLSSTDKDKVAENNDYSSKSNETNFEKVLNKNLKRHINLEDDISKKKKRDLNF